jgi:hypothetical protein
MKTLLTATNLFLGIYFTIRFAEILFTPYSQIDDFYYFILRIVVFPIIAITNLYHVLNFMKSK